MRDYPWRMLGVRIPRDVFEAGALASANLQAMAEGGSIAGLSADMGSVGAVLQGVDLSTLSRLSVGAMMLPTNNELIVGGRGCGWGRANRHTRRPEWRGRHSGHGGAGSRQRQCAHSPGSTR